MIIRNLHLFDLTRVPFEYNPPLIVNSNAVKTLKITLQGFDFIARRRSKVNQVLGTIKHVQLSDCNFYDIF